MHCATVGSNVEIDDDEPLVTVTKETMEAFDSRYVGSTFRRLKCSMCSRRVGKMFMTTPPVLDPIRGMISLDGSQISSYKLGSGSPLATKEKSKVRGVDEATTSVSSTISPVVALVGLDAHEALHLKEQIMMVQAVLVTLNDRVTAIESGSRKGVPESEATALVPPEKRKRL